MGLEVENIFEAKDGLIALEFISQNEIHLIISDLNMPNMNGLELLRKVKQSDKLKKIPFLIITGNTSAQGAAEAFVLGVDQYISKPFNVGFLAETIGHTFARLEGEVKST